MAQKPTAKEILNRFYDAERIYMASPVDKRDDSAMKATLAPDIKLYQSPDLPYPGTYTGIEEFMKWGQEMSSYFDKVDVQPTHVLEENDVVVILGTLRLRARATGEEWTNPFCQVDKVDRERGVITEIRPFYWDVARLNRAVGRKPE